MTQSHPTALITGASTGIGYELARLLARDKYRLVLVSRNRARLEQRAKELHQLGSPDVRIIARDLAELEAPDEIFAETERAGLRIDVLVNNAGFGVRGPFAKTNLDDELEMMQLNVVALVHLTKLYLPQMLARKSGRILQVASTAGFQPGPFMAVYYATKAFVLSFSEAIYEELRGTGVTVTCLCPGATETEFADRAGMRSSKLFQMRVMDARSVATQGYRGMLAGKPLVITGARNWLVAQSVRFSPRWLVRKIVRKMQGGDTDDTAAARGK
jgi:short-subunit dehydrogenase